MMKRLGCLVLVAAAFSIAGTQVRAQSAKTSDVDPDSVAALTKMSTYLRTLKAFQVNAVTTTDDVLDDGQLVQNEAQVSVVARRPDRLRVEITGDQKHRLYFYDGKQFTIYAQLVNFYATVPAPPTLQKLADALHEKYDIELPLEDLFYWGTTRLDAGVITSAYDVGPAQVGGVTCEQYAFRQKGLDWQIWIQLGDYPLPRKLVLTTTEDEARPQYSAVLNWNLAPSYDESSFMFTPPEHAEKIVLKGLSGESDEKANAPSAKSK